MGIFDFIKGGVREMMIARPDAQKALIVTKHPDPTIPNHAQLTVDADEAAVFFRDGAVVGVLRTAGAGQRHTLSSENIPFLGQIVDKFTGQNVFITDLYFVTMRPVYDQEFGGELGVVEDPLLGELITPRIYGTFSFQVVDPALFILQYVGLQQAGSNDDVLRWVKGLLLNGIRTVMGQVLVTRQKSMLELMAMQNELAEEFSKNAPNLAQIGCKVVQLGQFHVNLAEEDKQKLAKAQAEIGAAKRAARVAHIGVAQAAAEAQARQFELDQTYNQDARYVRDLAGNFATYAAGKAMIGAGQGLAQGGAGGAAGVGASLGAGFAMAQELGRAMSAGASAGAQAQPTPPRPGEVSCPSCERQVPAGKFCAECGGALAPKKRFCPSCGTEGSPTARFCASCGTAFGQPA